MNVFSQRKLLTVFVVGLLACSSEEVTQQVGAEERYRIGMSFFQDEEFLDAIEELKIVTIQFGGTEYGDDAQYYMAEARFLREEYVLAAYEYDVLIRTMPTSEYVRLARYRKASCYYNLSPSSDLDQEHTRKAIDEFQTFLEYHPTDSLAVRAEEKISELTKKLAQKEYESGVIYLKMSYFKAATYYFDLVLEKYHDTPYAELALFYKAEALINRKRYADAEASLVRFLERFPASDRVEEARRLLADARASLAETSPS